MTKSTTFNYDSTGTSPCASIKMLPHPRPYRRHSPIPLSQSLHASRAVISAVLATRARAGDDFLALARASPHAFDLHSTIRIAPLPRLNVPPHPHTPHDATYFSTLYRSALRPLPTVFDAETPPSVSIHDYVERIVTYGCVSNVVFLSAMMLVDRLSNTTPSMILTTYNIHRVFIAAFVIATKFHEDSYFANTFFSTLAGVPTSEINALEMAMLKMLNFRAAVSVEQLEDAECVLMSEAFDSSWGLTVYQTLRQENIASLDLAVAASTTWNTYEKVQDTTGTTSMKLVSGPDVLQLPPLHFPDNQLHPAIQALALVQAEVDFPNVDLLAEIDPEPGLVPLYSDTALSRFRRLRALAMGNVVDTMLPALERRGCQFEWSATHDRGPAYNTDWSYRASEWQPQQPDWSKPEPSRDWHRPEWTNTINWQPPATTWQTQDSKWLPNDTWAPHAQSEWQRPTEWPKAEWVQRPTAEWSHNNTAWPNQTTHWSPRRDVTWAQQSDWVASSTADWTQQGKGDWAAQSKNEWTRPTQPKSDWVVQAKNEWAAHTKSEWTHAKGEWTAQARNDWNMQQPGSEWSKQSSVNWAATKNTDWATQSAGEQSVPMNTDWPQQNNADWSVDRGNSWAYQPKGECVNEARSSWLQEHRSCWEQESQSSKIEHHVHQASSDVAMCNAAAPALGSMSLNIPRDHFSNAKGVATMCDKPYTDNVPFSFFENFGQYV